MRAGREGEEARMTARFPWKTECGLHHLPTGKTWGGAGARGDQGLSVRYLSDAQIGMHSWASEEGVWVTGLSWWDWHRDDCENHWIEWDPFEWGGGHGGIRVSQKTRARALVTTATAAGASSLWKIVSPICDSSGEDPSVASLSSTQPAWSLRGVEVADHWANPQGASCPSAAAPGVRLKRSPRGCQFSTQGLETPWIKMHGFQFHNYLQEHLVKKYDWPQERWCVEPLITYLVPLRNSEKSLEFIGRSPSVRWQLLVMWLWERQFIYFVSKIGRSFVPLVI